MSKQKNDHGSARRQEPASKPRYAVAAALLLPGMLAFGAQAKAQQLPFTTKGLTLGVHVADASWAPEVSTDGGEAARGEGERGLGIGVSAGYGVTPRLTAYLNGEGARVEPDGGGDSYTLSHGDLGLQYAFGQRALRPYLDLALTGRRAEVQTEDGSVGVVGGGITFGGGLRYFVSPALAIDGRIRRTPGGLDPVDDDLEGEVQVQDSPSTRVGVGLSWYPRW